MLSKELYIELATRLKRIDSSKEFLENELLTTYGKDEAKAVIQFLDENENCNRSDYLLMRVDLNNQIKSYRAQSGIMGLVVGDALGVPVEFTSRVDRENDPVVDMRAYGTHSQPAGTWSDDSSMVIATMEWYYELEEWPEDYKPLMDKFCNWLMHGDYTPYGENFDCGITVSRALMNYSRGMDPTECGEKTENSNGNGSLMRIMPTALFHTTDLAFDKLDNTEKIYEMSALTHGHARSKLGCLIYSKIISDILHKPDEDKVEVVKYSMKVLEKYLIMEEKDPEISEERETYKRLWNIDSFLEISIDEIKSSGYVVDTLEAALWCFLTTNSYKECVLKAVNLGDDTDTVGAVGGGLAGFYYGLESIPDEWINLIPKKEWILDLASGIYN